MAIPAASPPALARAMSGSFFNRIPVCDNEGKIACFDSRALLPEEKCLVCGTLVAAEEWIQQTGREIKVKNDDERLCPHCGSTGKESGLVVLDNQAPYLELREPLNLLYCGLLYGANLAREALATDKSTSGLFFLESCGLFFLESYNDIWALLSAGVDAAVAYLHRPASEFQLKALLELLEPFDTLPICLIPQTDSRSRVAASRLVTSIRELAPARRVQVLDLDWIKALEDVEGDIDVARAYHILGPEHLASEINNQANWLDGLSWQLRGLLTQGRFLACEAKDDIPWRNPKELTRLIGRLLHTATYEPPPGELHQVLASSGENWSEEYGDIFIETHLGCRHQVEGEMEIWARKHGSKEVIFGLDRGYDVMDMLLSEAAQSEFGQEAFVDSEDVVKCGKRNHPSREALSCLMRVSSKVPVPDWASVVRVLKRPPWADAKWPTASDYPGEEAVRIENWQGRYCVYLPIA